MPPVEAMALLEGLKLCASLGWGYVLFVEVEGDASNNLAKTTSLKS